jgi:hypothetical protein
LAGLMIRLRAPLSVVIVQVAFDTWLLMSRNRIPPDLRVSAGRSYNP